MADNWWSLHLRRARGEILSTDEQHRLDMELAKQDRIAPPLRTDLVSLKRLREEVLHRSQENDQLHARLAQLEQERTRVERALSPEIRQLLGVVE